VRVRLSKQQVAVMRTLVRAPATAHEVTRHPDAPPRLTYDSAHGVLARLEKRGLVARKGVVSGRTRASEWYLTQEGRQALE
jgi:predicted transcriptional regulator